MVEEVQGTIDWAKDKLESFPKAKKDLGPLLDALGRECSLMSVTHAVSYYHIIFRTSHPNRWWCGFVIVWRAQSCRQSS